MARSVTFGGQTQFKPGGITRIDATALTPIGPTATGIIGLIGEADGGQPNVAITIDDPVLAKSVFRSGPLADAIRLAFNPSSDPRIPSGAFRVICYKTNQSTQGFSQVPGDDFLVNDTAAAASSPTVINLTTGGLTVNAHINRWLLIGSEKRRIISNTANQVTVSPGFSTAPPTTTVVQILQSQMIVTARDYGSHTAQIALEVEPGVTTDTLVLTLSFAGKSEQSPELGALPFLYLVYKGGPIPLQGVAGAPAQNLPVTAATTTTVTATFTTAPTASQYDNLILEFSDGKRRKIASHTVGLSVVFTLDPTTPLTAAEATASVGQTVTVRSVTTATASIVGANGVATQLTSSVTPTADNLAITFTPNMTLKALVDLVNATSNYTATIPNGVNGDIILMKSFDFGTRATAVDVRFDLAVDSVNKNSFRRDLQLVVDWVNEFSTLAIATRATAGTSEGSEAPTTTGGVVATVGDAAIYFTGVQSDGSGLVVAARGISANSNWQAGFDALIETRMNHIVPLISQDLSLDGNGSTATFASVAQQLSAHVSIAAGVGKNEQGGYLGMKGTRAQIIAQSQALNNTDIQLIPQKFTVLNVDGNLVEQPEWSGAVIAAGMRSGAPEVGEPLTYKTIKTTGISNDPSWSPRQIGDVNAFIQNGVMFAEQTPAGIFRWVRDITTYLLNDNIVFMDGNMREEVRFIAYDLRTGLEDTFTGLKAKPATVASIREYVSAKMALYKTDNLITPSLDEDGNLVPDGFRKLRVFIDGNVATVRVEIYPVAGIVFELNDIVLQLPRLAA